MVQHGWANGKNAKPESTVGFSKVSINFLRWKRYVSTSVDYLHMVSQTSSMHGLAHITAPNRHWIERLMWLLVLLACVVGALHVTMSSYDLLLSRPTVMSMERDYMSWNTSFPAVTICPDVHVDPIALQIMASKIMFRLNVTTSEVIFFLTTLADSTIVNLPSSPFADVPGVNADEFLELILSMTPAWRHLMKGPGDEGTGDDETRGTPMDPIVTERGICYSYNSALAPFLHPRSIDKQWTAEDIEQILDTPVVQISPLDGRVLSQVMRVAYGFTVFLHGPFEIADVTSVGISVKAGQINTVSLSGQEVFMTKAAASLPPERRRCRLPSEGAPGANPPIYSFALCRRRCRARLSKKLCDCVPHWDSFLRYGTLCNANGLRCLGNFQDALVRIIDPNSEKPLDCNCLPSCDYVNYVIENKEVTPWFLGSGLEYGLSKYPRARFKRDIFYTPKDVLVSFGSAAGLFLGCSMLSLVEFVYFFTLGLYWHFRKGLRAKKANREDDTDNTNSRPQFSQDDLLGEVLNEIQPEILHEAHQRKRSGSSEEWRRRMLASSESRTKLLAWIE